MTWSMQNMIAPVGVPEFVAGLRARRFLFQPGAGENRFEGLLDWDAFRSVVESGVIPSHELTVTHKQARVDPMFYRSSSGVDAGKLASLLGRGGSVIARHLERHVPPLAALCEDVRSHIEDEVMAGAIVTTGAGGAVGVHYDTYDLAILQVEGSKRWMVYDQPVVHPVSGMAEPAAPAGTPFFDQVLQPGDFLLLPAGYWHRCENGPSRSLHVGIFFSSSAGWHAVQALLKQLLAEELFRVPLTRFASDADRVAHEAALKRHLIEKIEQMSMFDMISGPKESTKDRIPSAEG